jgi:16S rRNA (cytidine1402-2'-O)-methyltransferase
VIGTLIVCATPIGNLSDSTARLASSLASASIVYAEDTRRVRTLLQHLGVDAKVRSYFVGNESERSREMQEHLVAGETVALVTDAGTPSVADPGVSAVRAAVEVGAIVTGIPGPSAVTLALALSGESADRFVFEGFLPRKGKERKERLADLKTEVRTTVFFCAPSRLAADLADMATVAATRRCVVCREMTKMHEETWRGTVAEGAAYWAGRTVKGEVTLVVSGGETVAPSLGEAIAWSITLIESGESASAAVRSVAETTGVSRRALYEAVIDRRSQN